MAICEDCGYTDPPNKKGISTEMLIDGAISGNIVAYIREATGCAKQTVTNAIKNTFPDRNPIHSSSIIKFLLDKWDLRYCSRCTLVKENNEFYYNSNKSDGLSDYCKECSREARKTTYAKNPQKEIHANNIRRRRVHELQTPKWANIPAIIKFYNDRPLGMHVDHIYPLNSDWVCGLHVVENMQYLTIEENLSKNNKNIDYKAPIV